MAQYKGFAKQGSFSSNRLELPDQTGKMKESLNRQLRGMDTAQGFLEKNREIYLRAQQYAQQQERMNREDNFRFESENRKAYQDTIQRNNEIQLENIRRESAQTEKLFKDLSAFSKSAFELYGTFEEGRNKQRQADANNLVVQSGLDRETLSGFFSLDNNLTGQAFREHEYVQNFLANGGTEDQLRVIEAMRKTNSPQLYLDTKSAVQQSLPLYQSQLQQSIAELGEDATLEQVNAQLKASQASFISSNLKGVRAELLEASGFLPGLRSYHNQLQAKFSKRDADRREENFSREERQNITTVFGEGGGNNVVGIMEQQQINPSKRKRDNLQTWTLNGLRSGNLTPDQAESILDYKITVGGKQVAYRDQFPDFAAAVSDEMFKTRKRQQSEFNLREAERISTAEAELSQVIDSFAVDGDGRIDDNELETINQRAIQLGIPGSKIVEYAQQNSVSAATDRAVERYLGEKADNLTLTVEDVNGLKMGTNLRRRFLQIAKEQAQTKESPVYKDHVKVIENAISEHPQVKAARAQLGRDDYSVILMQNRYKQQYKANLKRLDSPDEALSLTLQQIKIMQSNVAAVNSEGRYVEIEKEVERRASQASKSLKEYQELMKAMSSDRFRKDAKFAVNSVGTANFYNSYNAMSKGGQPSAVIKSGAKLMGVDPLTFINYLAEGANVEPIKPLNDELQKLKESLPPITRRLYDTYRTNDRIVRATAVAAGSVANMPKRGVYSELLGMIRSGEGTYTSANRGTAGDSPAGIPMLDKITVGDWKKLQNSGWFALGAYQFIPETFRGAVSRLGLPDSTIMDAETQDMLAIELISGGTKRPALASYLNGQSNNLEAALTDLANEWAAVATEGGSSAYAGIGGNAASIGYDAASKALIRLREQLTSNK